MVLAGYTKLQAALRPLVFYPWRHPSKLLQASTSRRGGAKPRIAAHRCAYRSTQLRNSNFALQPAGRHASRGAAGAWCMAQSAARAATPA